MEFMDLVEPMELTEPVDLTDPMDPVDRGGRPAPRALPHA
ncbi:hypothetical protein GCM10023100_37120 [Actinocorallia cavernae]|uniref:Uncharacterized protein n=1 Tax=Actinocorallia cavernae TaxID=328075 RepID=A0ABP8SST8_9ACTN